LYPSENSAPLACLFIQIWKCILYTRLTPLYMGHFFIICSSPPSTYTHIFLFSICNSVAYEWEDGQKKKWGKSYGWVKNIGATHRGVRLLQLCSSFLRLNWGWLRRRMEFFEKGKQGNTLRWHGNKGTGFS